MTQLDVLGASSNPAKPTVITFRVPRTSDKKTLQSFANKYKTLRLMGLELSPEAFSSTLAIESQYPDDVWIRRLTNPQLETFIAAVTPSELIAENDIDLTDGRLEWIAQATIRGPISVSEFSLPVESGQQVMDPSLEDIEERWQFLGLYSLPTYRGQGIAKNLCQEALRWLQTSRLASNPVIQAIHARTMIKPDNLTSIGLFQKLGFLDIGLCTLAEALIANGDALPEEWTEQDIRRLRRYGRILSLTLVKQAISSEQPNSCST